MKKFVLPLVMMASLATLASCGQKDSDDTASRPSPVVTGEVVTPSTSATASVTPVSPLVLHRHETVSYNTPEGMVPVDFDVTVTDGIITAATATTMATTDASKFNQDKFIKEVGTKVVGKKAKDLKVDAIGGASLTTAAFEQFAHSF